MGIKVVARTKRLQHMNKLLAIYVASASIAIAIVGARPTQASTKPTIKGDYFVCQNGKVVPKSDTPWGNSLGGHWTQIKRDEVDRVKDMSIEVIVANPKTIYAGFEGSDKKILRDKFMDKFLREGANIPTSYKLFKVHADTGYDYRSNKLEPYGHPRYANKHDFVYELRNSKGKKMLLFTRGPFDIYKLMDDNGTPWNIEKTGKMMFRNKDYPLESLIDFMRCEKDSLNYREVGIIEVHSPAVKLVNGSYFPNRDEQYAKEVSHLQPLMLIIRESRILLEESPTKPTPISI